MFYKLNYAGKFEMQNDWLKKLSQKVDPLIQNDFKFLSKRGKNQLLELVKLTGGSRKKILNNLDDIISFARGLHYTIEELNESGFDHDEALKPGRAKVKLLNK
jgi:hypothetical protein